MLYANGKARYQSEYNALWDELVPVSGQAETVQGELVRVIGGLANECYRNGNGNWDMGFRMYTNFLHKHLRDARVFQPDAFAGVESDIDAIRAWGSGTRGIDYTDGEDPFDRLTDRVVEWCQHYPTLLPHVKNPRLRR